MDPLDAVLDVASLLVAETDQRTVVRTIVESALRLVDADDAACALVDPDGDIVDVVHAKGSADRTLAAFARAAIRSDGAVFRAEAGELSEGGATRQLLGAPLRARQQLIAVLYAIRSSAAPPFADDDAHRLGLLAAPAGAAVANTQAFEGGRRREQWLETLAGVGTSLLSGQEMRHVLSAVVRQAREIVAADGAAVAVPVEGEDAVVVRDAVGAESDRLIGLELPASTSLLGRCMREGATIEVEELASDARAAIRDWLVANVGPAIYMPLGTPDAVRGVLLVYNVIGRPSFDRQAVTMLDAFARQVGVALELADRRQDATRLALLEDRERIARDLHDVVIQRLFAIGLTLDGAGRSVADPGAQRLMTRAVDELDQTIKEIRTTIFGLEAPSGPEYSSLRARIVGIVDQATKALGYVPSLRFEGLIDTKVPASLSDQVVAVVREALSNVARHAHAENVDVKLSVTDDDLTLLVEDDGIGIPEGGRRSGLRNMAARAAAYGGRLVVGRRQPSGTHLEWTVPLRRPPTAN